MLKVPLMKVLPAKRLYLPAVTIIAAVLVLLALISLMTYRSLDREERAAVKFFHGHGLALLRALEAGARTGMLMPLWGEDSVGQLLRETAKDEGIAYIYLMDERGNVNHHSDQALEGSRSDHGASSLNQGEVLGRIRKTPSGPSIYELAKRFSPLAFPENRTNRPGANFFHTHQNDIVVLGLKMDHLDEARRSDLQHAIVMGAIVLITGSGALFFIVVIQNFYLVERTLKETRDYSQLLIASMPSGVLGIDPAGKITAYNRQAVEILGVEENALEKANIFEVIDAAPGLAEALAGCRPVLDREFLHRPSAAASIPLSLSLTPILAAGGACQGGVIVIRDLREIKVLEAKVRRAQKLAAVGELAAGLAHEIRNPLSSIRGFAQFLRHTLRDRPKEQEYAQTMVAEIDRINRVVTDLLSLARPKEPEISTADIAKLVRHATRLVRGEAKARGIRLESSLPPDDARFPLDGVLITQALLNLLINSIQAVGRQGRITTGARLSGDGRGLRLWVEDDGPGIRPELQARIFDPFFTTREAGTGLGLAIVRSVAECHGGSIHLESPLPGMNHGCRIALELPAPARSGAEPVLPTVNEPAMLADARR
jgi:two-component system, NtrC family, sensor histidine kinase HydH